MKYGCSHELFVHLWRRHCCEWICLRVVFASKVHCRTGGFEKLLLHFLIISLLIKPEATPWDETMTKHLRRTRFKRKPILFWVTPKQRDYKSFPFCTAELTSAVVLYLTAVTSNRNIWALEHLMSLSVRVNPKLIVVCCVEVINAEKKIGLSSRFSRFLK